MYLAENYQNMLKKNLLKHRDIYARLLFLREVKPEAFCSAGVIRNLIWSVAHDQHYELSQTEIDVIFYDAEDESGFEQRHLAEILKQKFPENDWDVVNQAWVHQWYITENGESIAPLQSIQHALSLWPETATAVAVRLLENNELEIIAPFGLDDLFELKLRWNAALASHHVFMQRMAEKQFLQKWNKLSLL
ncbi:nucleotidyltransferase family protein [Acinetobacter sp. ANC 4470]|uniref:nucleotidyltransferase family protein n=1 Tax=Acinetobacter sp. ANC 4470 TaxID=1977881 RepID=UPI001D173791|nr:nucleotidyltransferase family protein [Acinetobacter sp. ANC 4470]